MSYSYLKNAYDLIQQGKMPEALPIVAAVVKAEPDNCDAWWLAVFVAQTPRQKRIALERVLYLNPTHGPAKILMQRMLQEADAAPSTPSRPARPIRKKRQIKWSYVLLSAFGLLSLFMVGLVMVDNFMGAGILDPIERLIMGEPEALGWVNRNTGAKMAAPNDPSAQIPITNARNVRGFGSQIVGILDHDEAHRINFYATRGDQLVIAAAFSNNGNTSITGMVLWDSNGQVVAREVSGEEFDLGALFGARGLTYDVVQSGTFSLVIIANPAGGPSGNYTLIVDTLANALDEG